jgi:N-methylhydantoinase A/oxoprolinase/acetone carboxylase beta subunit
LPVLDDQLAGERPGEFDGRFALPVLRKGRNLSGLSDRERGLIERLGDRPMPVAALIRARVEVAALERLVARGLVQIAGFTPSDASHVLDRQQGWNRPAAEKGAMLFARQRTAAGEAYAEDAATVCRAVIDQLTGQTCEILLETALAEDGFDHPERLARHELALAGMEGHRGVARLSAGLNLPLIGLGASAPAYYGAVARRLGCEAVLHEHAGVANAIGAVVGQVRLTVRVMVTSPAEGRFRVHLDSGPEDFTTRDAALDRAEAAAREAAERDALAAGAAALRLESRRDLKQVAVEGRETFVEAEVTATATGRPGISGQLRQD